MGVEEMIRRRERTKYIYVLCSKKTTTKYFYLANIGEAFFNSHPGELWEFSMGHTF